MKTMRLCLAAAALAIAPLTHADDHGDTADTATRVALPSETPGVIDPGDDVDLFRFKVPASRFVTIETTGGLDSIGALFAEDGALLGLNDNSGAVRNFHIQRALDAGAYYVRVTSFGSGTGSYVLHLRATEADDHGDDASSATSVAFPSQTFGVIDPASDEDWFRFEITSAVTVTVFTSTFSGSETGVDLYDEDGNELADTDTNSHPLDAGAYYVRVTSFDSTGSYWLHLQDDHPDSRSRATPVALPSATGGVLDAHHDRDWFRFEVTTPGIVTRAVAGVRSYEDAGSALLYDESGNFLSSTGLNASLPLDYGTYYLGLGAQRISAARSYVLHLRTGGQVELRRVAAPVHLRALGDFNGDGKDDVLLRHWDGRWHYYPMAAESGSSCSGIACGVGASLTRDLAWQTAGIGDFNGDGKDDVLLRKTDGRWYYYPMDGPTSLDGRGTVRLTRDLAWQMAGIGDFDGDGKDDVLLRKTDGRWFLYPMDGRTVLGGRGTVPLTRDLAWQMAGIGDFDGDGQHDVLLRRADSPHSPNPYGPETISRWLFYPLQGRQVLAGEGDFEAAFPAATLGGIGDLNGDGRDDLLLRWPVESYDDPDGDGIVERVNPVYGEWYFYALDGPRVVSASVAWMGDDVAWGALGRDTFHECAECPLMVRIPAGTFTQGAPESEPHSRGNERPQRTVSIPAFAASAHEVTFAEWDACVAAGGCGGYRPDWGRFGLPSAAHRRHWPVVNVSWDDAQLYVDWLSAVTGQRYRLLTESEWEYAARAGTTTPFHTGETITTEQANFDGRYDYLDEDENELGLYRDRATPFGLFPPNGFGLYDMHGNVWEWVQDCYGSYAEATSDGSAVEDDCGPRRRVVRGGGWLSRPEVLRAALRNRATSGVRASALGFRVARTL